MSIYLDNSAITKPKKEVIKVVTDILNDQWYNPNSVYNKGLESKRIIEKSKAVIANELNCNSNELIMCSCGSEANTLALSGYITRNKCNHFITSNIEHTSIINNPYSICDINVNEYGEYLIDDIKNIYGSLVCLSYANSEIGTIQNIKEIINILHQNNCIVHIDAVAAFGKIKIDVKDIDVDMLTITAQKIGGILGAACLYKKQNIELEPIIYGHDIRSGTPNVPAIAGFAKAVELIDYKKEKILLNKREYLLNNILGCNISLNGSKHNRLPNNINICIHNSKLNSQQLLSLLDLRGYEISTGSACNSGNKQPSKVLKAIGLSDEDANNSIRITISENNTYEDLDRFSYDLFNIIDIYK